MRKQPPCIEWAEKLALRYEDLSSADQVALDAHVHTCSVCATAQMDYRDLDMRLHTLPLSQVKLLPRLPVQLLEVGEEGIADVNQEAYMLKQAVGYTYSRYSHPRASLKAVKSAKLHTVASVLSGMLVASLIFASVFLFGVLRYMMTPGSLPTGTLLFTLRGESADVGAVAWSPNKEWIATTNWDGSVQIWDAATGDLRSTRNIGTRYNVIDALAWSPDSNSIAIGDWSHQMQVLNASTGATRFTVSVQDEIYALAWSPDGKSIAIGDADQTVTIWDVASKSLRLTYRGHHAAVHALAWSPNGEYIASGGGDIASGGGDNTSDDTVQVWNASTGKVFYTYSSHTGAVTAVAWAPDGKRIASASVDKTVQVWEAEAGAPTLFTYRGHTAEVDTLAWSPDGQRIASGGWDNTVQVWNALTGAPFFTYRGHTSEVDSLAWSPDGQFIASASIDQTVQVFKAVPANQG